MTNQFESGSTDMDIPREPANLSDVAFVDEAFWHTTDDGRWVAWDRDDWEVEAWADLVAIARKQDQRDPVVYILESEAKTLAETATRLGRELGRREAGEEIAQQITAHYIPIHNVGGADPIPSDPTEWDEALHLAAEIARGRILPASGASSEPLSAPGVGTGDTEGGEGA